MLTSYAVGLLAVVGLMVGWVTVQRAWRHSFPAAGPETDALAGRPGCAGCTRSASGRCDKPENDSIRVAQACRNRGTSPAARGGELS